MLGSDAFPETTIVVADMEAGINTLTRLGDQRLDVVLVVVEPTPRSIEVADRAATLARANSQGRVIVVASRTDDADDMARLRAAFPHDTIWPVVTDDEIVKAERAGVAPLDTAPDSPAVRSLRALAESLLPGDDDTTPT